MELTVTVQAVCILSRPLSRPMPLFCWAKIIQNKANRKTFFVAESVPIFVNGKPLTCISKPLVRFKAGESGFCSGFILSAALTSFTKPDLSENWTANKELSACRLIFLAIRETTILSSKPILITAVINAIEKRKTLHFRNRSLRFSRLYLSDV